MTMVTDPVEAAKAAHLRYVNASELAAGITRRKSGKGFSYVDEQGKAIHDEKTLARIRSLAIPPAWTNVWICPTENGHIQAVGRDAKGRKQYRYHPRWRKTRDETKYHRMLDFGKALPKMREQMERDLKLSGLPRVKVLALVISLLETTYIRIGNAEYARNNKHFGLTTLKDKHVEIDGATVTFEFIGKSGKRQSVELHDRRFAALVRRCKELPGQDLFQYMDEAGQHQHITSTDVNAYLHDISGQDFTAKDFRTWGGTALSVLVLQEIGPAESETQAKKNIAEAVRQVAEQLGNTPAVCSKYYMHPAVTAAYADGSLFEVLTAEAKKKDSPNALRFEERVVMKLLKDQA
jgi:DNA topoisomerase-1